jgi:UTP--glucose-1-phosphate uridylyltransferase
VEEAVACGVELVTIITALNKKSIEDYFDHHFELENLLEERVNIEAAEQIRRLCEMVDICYVRQKRQLGLGHALLSARNVIGDEAFMLLLPDDLFEQGDAVLRHMLEIHSIYQSSVVAVQRVPHKEVSRYGIIESQRLDERLYRVAGLIEKPAPADAPSDLAIMGRYILTLDIFPLLENTLPGTNGEIQLTDAMQKLLRHNAVYAYEFAGERFDLGTPMGWLKTTIALSLRDPLSVLR